MTYHSQKSVRQRMRAKGVPTSAENVERIQRVVNQTDSQRALAQRIAVETGKTGLHTHGGSPVNVEGARRAMLRRVNSERGRAR